MVNADSQMWLLNPNSEYMRNFDILSTSALVFTALVTPFEVSFLPAAARVDPLFVINRVIDPRIDRVIDRLIECVDCHMVKTSFVYIKFSVKRTSGRPWRVPGGPLEGSWRSLEGP